jgi:hypothetical protein
VLPARLSGLWPAQKLDWHDLVQVLEHKFLKVALPAPAPWCLMRRSDRLAWLEILGEADWLSAWEREFASIAEGAGRRLSAKQGAILDRLTRRAHARRPHDLQVR